MIWIETPPPVEIAADTQYGILKLQMLLLRVSSFFLSMPKIMKSIQVEVGPS